MARRLRCLLALASLIAGCTGTPTELTVQPEWPDGDYWFGALAIEGGQLKSSTALVHSSELDKLELPALSMSTTLELWIVGFSGPSIRAIGAEQSNELETAPLVLAGPGDWKLPLPDWSEVREIVDGAATTNTREVARLTAAWCRAVDPCARHVLEARAIALEEAPARPVDLIQPVSERKALVVTGTSTLEVELPEGTVTPLTQLSTSTGFRSSVEINGELYFLNRYPELIRVQTVPDYSLLPVEPLPPGDRVSASLDGGLTPDGFELFVWSDHGQLLRSTGGNWETVYDLGRPADVSSIGLLWIEPGYVAFAERRPHNVYVWRDGSVTAIPAEYRPNSLYWDPGFGLIVGSDISRFFRVEGDRLVLIEGPPIIGDAVNLMSPFGDGFTYAQNDAVGFFDPATGWCVPRDGLAGSTGRLNTLEGFPSGILFGGNPGTNFDVPSVVFLEDLGPSAPICDPP